MDKISFCEIDGDLFTQLVEQNARDFRIGGAQPRRYVMHCGAVCVGLGATWSNPIHPYRRYVMLFIVPAFRRQGLGGRLFALIKQNENENKWQTGVDSYDADAAAFAKSLGFCLARRCFLCEAELVLAAEPPEPDGLESLCAAGEQTLLLCQELLYDSYKEKHSRVNSLSAELDAKGLWRLVADGLSSEDSFILSCKSGHALLLCYGEGEGEVEVGYSVCDCDRPDYERFIYAALRRLGLRYTSLCFEADDCDPDALCLAVLAGAELDSSFDSYTLG